MPVSEILQSVQFVVDQNGKPTAPVLDIQAWEAVISLVESVEDHGLLRERLDNWRTKDGWTPWSEFVAEMDADGLYSLKENIL